MRWSRQPRTPKDKTRWHGWFAWHPVKMESTSMHDPIVRVWLERVEREGTWIMTGLGMRMMWRYRERTEASK